MKLLKNWLNDEKHQKKFESYVKNHFYLNLLLQEPDVDEAYEKILSQIQSTAKPVKRLFPQWYKYAAIFIGVLTIALGVYTYVNLNEEMSTSNLNKITLELEDGSLKELDENISEIIVNTKGQQMVSHQQNILLYTDSIITDIHSDKIIYNQLTVPYGKKFQLVLSDSTHIFLNSGSKIKYPTKFLPNENRNVFLDGEAFFSVTKNEHQPFTVVTEGMNTVVLGTQFNVSSYKNENNTSVVLVEGSVQVQDSNATKTEYISPGERAIFEDGRITIDKVNIEKHIAWTKNQLYFVDDHFGLIIKELERHFDVKIHSNHSALNKKMFTGTFETETLEQILTTFQLHSTFEYHRVLESNSIIIKTNE